MNTPRIIVAESAKDLAVAAALFREYAAGLPFSLCFQGFDAEVANLPGRYGPPSGRLLLAMLGDEPVGCVAFRAIAAAAGDPAPVCEMKRLFVKPSARGLGIGRLLCERLLADARGRGYAMMKLDTEPDFHAAIGLYTALGFTPIPRYNDDPHPQTGYFGLRLASQPPGGQSPQTTSSP